MSAPIRPATASDVGSITDVINRAYQVESFFKIGDRTSAAEVAEKMSEPGALFLVVDNEPGAEHRLAGAVFVRVDGDRGYFGPLAVDPSAQGRGLGRALIESAEAHSRERGCRHMDLDIVNLRTELPAFYRALGYVESGMKPFPKEERLSRPAHMVLMTKEL